MGVPVVVADSTPPVWATGMTAVSELMVPLWASRIEAEALPVMLTAPALAHVDVKPVPAVAPLRSIETGATLIVAVAVELDSAPSLATKFTEIEAALTGPELL